MTRAEMEIKVAELKEWEALLEEAKEQAAEFVDDHEAIEDLKFGYHTAFSLTRIKPEFIEKYMPKEDNI